MPCLAERMLATGCVPSLEHSHGEPVKILTGGDAGRTFTAVIETEEDVALITDLSEDRRSRRIARFRIGGIPRIKSQEVVQTDDGQKWNAVRQPGNAFLTVDFELREIAAVDQ